MQKALSSYEDRPVGIITKQKIDESVFIIRGKDKGLPAWHYIMVPISKAADLKSQKAGITIDVTNFGAVVKYRNKRGETKTASGWGTDPPEMLQIWIGSRYG